MVSRIETKVGIREEAPGAVFRCLNTLEDGQSRGLSEAIFEPGKGLLVAIPRAKTAAS